MADARLLELDSLCVDRGVLRVVDQVTFGARAGTCIGLLGLNGAGKSSLLAALAGLLPASAGSVRFDGNEIVALPPWDRANAGLSLVPSGRQLWPDITVEDTLHIGAYRIRSKESIRAALEGVFEHFPILRDKRRQRAQELSGGQQQMLAIGRALMAQPTMLLLDEPSEGLAPVVVDEVFDVIARLRDEQGLTILLAEQNAGMAEICDEMLVMRDGRVLSVGADAAGLEDVVFES